MTFKVEAQYADSPSLMYNSKKRRFHIGDSSPTVSHDTVLKSLGRLSGAENQRMKSKLKYNFRFEDSENDPLAIYFPGTAAPSDCINTPDPTRLITLKKSTDFEEAIMLKDTKYLSSYASKNIVKSSLRNILCSSSDEKEGLIEEFDPLTASVSTEEVKQQLMRSKLLDGQTCLSNAPELNDSEIDDLLW